MFSHAALTSGNDDRGQPSLVFPLFAPASLKPCLMQRISVTVSAKSMSARVAWRPIMTTHARVSLSYPSKQTLPEQALEAPEISSSITRSFRPTSAL
jgi:hypothetical protein